LAVAIALSASQGDILVSSSASQEQKGDVSVGKAGTRLRYHGHHGIAQSPAGLAPGDAGSNSAWTQWQQQGGA